MLAAGLIAVMSLAAWLYLSDKMKLPADSPGYGLDVPGQPWSFLYFFDRYRAICSQVAWLAVIGMLAAAYEHDGLALWLLFAALAVSLLLQSCILLWYEGSVHGFVYTSRKYAAVLVMSLALPVYFVGGLAVLVARF